MLAFSLALLFVAVYLVVMLRVNIEDAHEECPNCEDDCFAEVYCEGCDMTLCTLCYNEHNAIHFEEQDWPHNVYKCDNCSEAFGDSIPCAFTNAS